MLICALGERIIDLKNSKNNRQTFNVAKTLMQSRVYTILNTPNISLKDNMLRFLLYEVFQPISFQKKCQLQGIFLFLVV